MHTFSELFEILDYELKQQKEFGDRGDPDKFRYLRMVDAKRVVSDTLYYLYSLNPELSLQEISVVGRDMADYTVEYYDSVIYFEQGDNYLKVPDRVFNINGIKIDTKWLKLYDSSDLNATWYSPKRDRLVYRGENFDNEKSFSLLASLYPKRIKDNVELENLTADTVLGSTFSLSVGSPHKFEVGDRVTLSSTSETSLNGTFTVVAYTEGHIFVNGADFLFPVFDVHLVFDTDNQEIDIPAEYFDMLVLEIKRKVYARKEERMSPYEYAQLNQVYLPRWKNEQGRVRQASHLSSWGYGFGKR